VECVRRATQEATRRAGAWWARRSEPAVLALLSFSTARSSPAAQVTLATVNPISRLSLPASLTERPRPRQPRGHEHRLTSRESYVELGRTRYISQQARPASSPRGASRASRAPRGPRRECTTTSTRPTRAWRGAGWHGDWVEAGCHDHAPHVLKRQRRRRRRPWRTSSTTFSTSSIAHNSRTCAHRYVPSYAPAHAISGFGLESSWADEYLPHCLAGWLAAAE
jgi:hypothetical protein